MKNAYAKLYNAFSCEGGLTNMAQFVAKRGEDYSRQDIRFMLIGRAPNDWAITEKDNGAAGFAQKAHELFETGDRWNWLENRNGGLYCGSYCWSKAPFWKYSKPIWEGLQPTDACPKNLFWMRNILWSNLYKVSPKGGGNPDGKMMDLQREACIEILKKELDACKPTHILIMSGYDWFAPFASVFENPQERQEKNVAWGKNKNSVYVEGYATYKGAKVVIACRPDFRNKADYVEEVLKYFRMESKENMFG